MSVFRILMEEQAVLVSLKSQVLLCFVKHGTQSFLCGTQQLEHNRGDILVTLKKALPVSLKYFHRNS